MTWRVKKVLKAGCVVSAVVLLVGASSVLLAACGSSASGEPVSYSGSGYPNSDPANTRNVSGPIKSSSVNELEIAWTLPINAESSFGSYASSPIVSNTSSRSP